MFVFKLFILWRFIIPDNFLSIFQHLPCRVDFLPFKEFLFELRIDMRRIPDDAANFNEQ